MSVQLFKDGGWELFDPNSIHSMLDAGWSLTDEEAKKPKTTGPSDDELVEAQAIIDAEGVERNALVEAASNKVIRAAAELAGVEHNARIDPLKMALMATE